MNSMELIILIVSLAVLAEVTFLLAKQSKQSLSRNSARSVLVDTSVLIDGRILPVVETGFIGDTLIIPRSVIGELQFLADNADHEKRGRARFGLDAVTTLQHSEKVEVQILQDGSKAAEGVDERLLNLAKKHNALVCTLDYNLSKVAAVEGIQVLNLNELAQSIRMAYLPGERLKIDLVQKGQDSHQAVGYLGDGTMVVVEHASKQLGQQVEIDVIRSLQTAAGKMMFARLVEQKQPKTPRPTGTKPVPAATEQPQSQPQPKQQPRRNKPQRQRQSQADVEVAATAVASEPVKQTQRPRKQQQGRQRRPRTQADREASLIELVDKQPQ